VGNKADVSSNDLLEYWEADPETAVIPLYLESFGNPRRFARLARRIGRNKPIVAVKAGRTRAGTRAAGSHPAALTASDIAVDALIVIYTPVDPRASGETLEAIRDGIGAGRRAGATGKPVLACLMAGDGRPLPLDLQSERIPAYAFPENAARALGRAAAYASWRAQPPALLWSFEDIRG